MKGILCAAAAATVFACGFTPPPAMAQPDTSAAVQTLDDASLKAMLEGFGSEVKTLNKGFLITYADDTWTVAVQVVLSPDKTKLGFNANLGKIDDLAAVPAAKWLGLLVANGKIDPSTFYVSEDSKELFLHRVIDNRGVTPEVLRVQLENFVGNVINNADTWDLTK